MVPVTAADWVVDCVTSCVFPASGGGAAGQGPGGDTVSVTIADWVAGCVMSCVFPASGGGAAGQGPGGAGGPGGHQGVGSADDQTEVSSHCGLRQHGAGWQRNTTENGCLKRLYQEAVL